MTSDPGEPRTWHIITCEYPPQIGGVSDYSRAVACGLGARSETHVWAPGHEAAPATEHDTVVHRMLGRFTPRDLRRVGRLLNEWPHPRRLFVQWVPQGFGYRSLNLGFAVWLAGRARWHGDHVHLMVHEPFLPWSTNPRHLVAAVIQRAMLAMSGRWATHVWLSTETWRPLVRPYVGRAPIDWLPVPAAATDRPANPADSPAQRHTPVVGHFGTYSPHLTPLLTRAVERILEDPLVEIVLLGRGSCDYLASFVHTHPTVATRIRATGVLPSDDLTRALHQCDVMLQPYPDGITTRRTSTLWLLALGRPIVTNEGALSEAFWSTSGALRVVPSPDGEQLGAEVERLLRNEEERLSLCARARALYDERFDARHAVAALEGAA